MNSNALNHSVHYSPKNPKDLLLDFMAVERDPLRLLARLPDIVALLDDKQASIRNCAIQTLTQLGPLAQCAVLPLRELLIIDDDARPQLFAALARIAFPQCLQMLGEFLHDVQAQTRAAAATALGRVGLRGLPLQADLIDLLKDDDSRVYLAAALSLSTQREWAQAALAPLLALKNQRTYPPFNAVFVAALDDISRACRAKHFRSRAGLAWEPARQHLLDCLYDVPLTLDELSLRDWVVRIASLDHEAGVRAAIACGYRTIQLWDAQGYGDCSPRATLAAAQAWVRCPCDTHLLAAEVAAQRIPSPGSSDGAFAAAWVACHAARIAVDGSAAAAALYAHKALVMSEQEGAGSVPEFPMPSDATLVALVMECIQDELIPWCQGCWDPVAPNDSIWAECGLVAGEQEV